MEADGDILAEGLVEALGEVDDDGDID